MSVVRVERMPDGTPRLFLGSARCHHYDVGAALMVVGAYLAWLDRVDILDDAIRAFEWVRRRTPWAS